MGIRQQKKSKLGAEEISDHHKKASFDDPDGKRVNLAHLIVKLFHGVPTFPERMVTQDLGEAQ